MLMTKALESLDLEDLEQLAMIVHSLTGLPTAAMDLNGKGIRIEKGDVIDRKYKGPVLEEVLKTNKVVHTFAAQGAYMGKPVTVSPIRSKDGNVVAAIGVVDIIELLDLLCVSKN